MKIVDVSRLAFPEVAVIRFARFKDHWRSRVAPRLGVGPRCPLGALHV